MKRFEFGLARVLQLKQQQERVAEMRQAQARLAWEAALAEVHALVAKLAELAQMLEAPPDAGGEAVSRMARYQQAVTLGGQIERADAAAKLAELKLQEAEQKRKQIATEVEVLKALKHQQWQEHRQAVMRAQQEHLDEVGLRRWMAKQTESAP